MLFIGIIVVILLGCLVCEGVTVINCINSVGSKINDINYEVKNIPIEIHKVAEKVESLEWVSKAIHGDLERIERKLFAIQQQLI